MRLHFPRARRLALLAPLLLAACNVPTRRGPEWTGAAWEGGADGFPSIELATGEPPCLPLVAQESQPLPYAIEGGADGFTETSWADDLPTCAALGASGWAAIGGWDSHRGWIPFGNSTGEPRDAGTGWGTTRIGGQGGTGFVPTFLSLWPGSPPPGIQTREPDETDLASPADEPILLVADPPAPPPAPAISEPTTLLLLGGALLVLGLLKRKEESSFF